MNWGSRGVLFFVGVAQFVYELTQMYDGLSWDTDDAAMAAALETRCHQSDGEAVEVKAWETAVY